MICKSLSWSKDMVASLFLLSLNGAVVMPQETLQGRNQCGRSRRGCSIFQYKYIQSPSHCCTTVLFLFQTLMALPEEHLLLVGAPQRIVRAGKKDRPGARARSGTRTGPRGIWSGTSGTSVKPGNQLFRKTRPACRHARRNV